MRLDTVAHKYLEALEHFWLEAVEDCLPPDNCSHWQRGKIRPQGADPLIKVLLSLPLLSSSLLFPALLIPLYSLPLLFSIFFSFPSLFSILFPYLLCLDLSVPQFSHL